MHPQKLLFVFALVLCARFQLAPAEPLPFRPTCIASDDSPIRKSDTPPPDEKTGISGPDLSTPRRLPVPEELPLESNGTTLDDLLGIALANHPGLATARARIHGAQGTWKQVGLRPNPNFGYSAAEVGNDDAWGQHGLFISKTIVRGDKLGLNRSVASHDVRSARQAYSAMEQRILNDVKVAFYRALIAQQRREVTNQLVDLTAESLRTAEKLRQAEELTRISVLQSTTELQMVQLAAVAANSREVGSKRELAATTGRAGQTVGRLVGETLEALPNHEWQVARERLTDCPQLAMQLTAIEKAKCALVRARAEQVPNVQLQAGVMFDDSTNNTAANFTVSRPLLIHNWNQGNICRARADLAAATHEFDRLILRLEKDLAVVFQAYQVAHQQVNSYVTQILPSSRQTLELVMQGFRAGEVDYLTVLTTQRTYIRTYLKYLDSLQLAWQSSVQIDGLLLSGSLPPSN